MAKNSIILLIIVAAAAFYVGYLWGFKTGEEAGQTSQAPRTTPTPGVDTGYQNPFEGVKLNPFR